MLQSGRVEDRVSADRQPRPMYKGKAVTVNELSRLTGVSAGTLFRRLNQGWSVKRAISEPVQRQNRLELPDGWPLPGISRRTVGRRLEAGWSLDRACTEPVER